MYRESSKITLRSYNEVEKLANEILKEKGQATAREICDHINDNYNIANRMGVTSYKISSYFRKKKYRSVKKGKNTGLTFCYD